MRFRKPRTDREWLVALRVGLEIQLSPLKYGVNYRYAAISIIRRNLQ